MMDFVNSDFYLMRSESPVQLHFDLSACFFVSSSSSHNLKISFRKSGSSWTLDSTRGPKWECISASDNDQRKYSHANIWKFRQRLLTFLPISFIECLKEKLLPNHVRNVSHFAQDDLSFSLFPLSSALISREFSLKSDLKSRSRVSVMNGDRFLIASPGWTGMLGEIQTLAEK